MGKGATLSLSPATRSPILLGQLAICPSATCQQTPGKPRIITSNACVGCIKGTMLVGFVMACELFPAVYRTYAGTVVELFWAAAWMFLALLAYLIRDWRHLQLAITLPGILALPLIWYACMRFFTTN